MCVCVSSRLPIPVTKRTQLRIGRHSKDVFSSNRWNFDRDTRKFIENLKMRFQVPCLWRMTIQKAYLGSISVPVAFVLAIFPVYSCGFVLPHCARAETVRVEDVTSPSLRAGLEAANDGNLDAAERFFQAYILEEPDSASGFSNLGNVHLQMGRTKLALENFTKAIELAPNAPVPHLNRAIALEQLGVDAMDRNDSKAANAYWEKAVDDCNIAIEADPKEFAAYFDRGNVQMRQARWEDALTSFTKAADLAPGLAGYRLRSAALIFQCSDPELAEQKLRGLTRKYSNYAEAHAALAAVQWSNGKLDQAEEHFARATEIDENLWKNIESVKKSTRWPPKLYDAYTRLLQLS